MLAIETILKRMTLDWIAVDRFLTDASFALLGSADSGRAWSLVLGLIGIVAGYLLHQTHQRNFAEVLATEESERIRLFETRKFRRRWTVSALVAATGCLLAGLYWVIDPKTFAIFILLIMSLLIGILGIALFDMFSVSLQTLTRTDDSARQALVDEYLKRREEE